MPQCVTPAVASAEADPTISVSLADMCCELLKLFMEVPDGRSGQGRDHPVAAVLALSAAATIAGMKGYTAIAGWIADVPDRLPADLYMRSGAAPAPPPSKSTIWRVLSAVDAEALDAAIGTWLTSTALTSTSGSDQAAAGLIQLRLDGKTVRGAQDADGHQLHLLAALAGPPERAVVAAQTRVQAAKPNETIAARDLLTHLDLTGMVVTADALHTVKATATQIRAQGGHFILPVKENRPALFDALDALPWRTTPIAHRSTDKGHGRITTRTIQILPAPPGPPFPEVCQVWLIERHVSDTRGKAISAIAQLGVASPDDSLLTAADPARYVQDHWCVEVLHWIRDTLFREDDSTVRTGSGSRVLASLRNLAIGALRLAGRTDITRSHPLGLPLHGQAVLHPGTHHVILKRPCHRGCAKRSRVITLSRELRRADFISPVYGKAGTGIGRHMNLGSLEDLLFRTTMLIHSGGKSGTGFFVAPNTIVTCAHVATHDTCAIIWNGREVSATVHERLPDLKGRLVDPYPMPDLAFLTTEEIPGHPYVELDPEVPNTGFHGDGLWAVGWSRSYVSTSFGREDVRLTATGGMDQDGRHLIKVTGDVIHDGMSGAPVLNTRTGRVCGLLKRTADLRIPNGGWFVPFAPLMETVPALAAVAGPSEPWRNERRRALGPTLRRLLTIPVPERPHARELTSPSWPLRAEYRVVPFHGRDDQKAGFVEWCHHDAPLALRLVTGQGGTGKTRLALELAREMHAQGWVAGLLSPTIMDDDAADRREEFVDQLNRIGEDTLLVIDYAEGLPALADLLDRLGELFDRPAEPRPGPRWRLRVLLLARHPGEWWTTILPARLSNRRMRLLVERRETVRPLWGLSDEVAAQHADLALKAFATALGVARVPPVPSVPPATADKRPPVLQIHAAALLAVLRAKEESGSADDPEPVHIDEILDELLVRESRFWTRSSAARGLPGIYETTRRQVVALAALVGADDADFGATLIRRVFELNMPTSIEVATWLSELYPAHGPDESRYWAPLRPDIIGERLIVQVFAAHPALANSALDGLPENRLSNALIVITRACAHSDQARGLLVRLLRANPAERLPAAVRIAPKAGKPLGSIITEVVADGELDNGLLTAIVDALPGSSVELYPLMAYLVRLASQEQDPLKLDDAHLAALHEANGSRLMLEGQFPEALDHYFEALARYERLYDDDPETHLGDLMDTLAAMCVALMNAGRSKEAIALCAKTAELARAQENPSWSSAIGLVSVGETLHGLGRLPEAMETLDDAIALLGRLDDDPDLRAFTASAMATRALILTTLGRLTEADDTITAAYRIVESLAADEPDHFAIQFAEVSSVRSLTTMLSSQDATASAFIDDTVRRLRVLVEGGFGLLTLNLVLLLLYQAGEAVDQGDWALARRLSEEALTIARRQTEAGHRRMGQVLVHTLASLAEMGEHLPGFLESVIPRARERLSGPGEPPTEADLLGEIAEEVQRLAEESAGPADQMFLLFSMATAAYSAGNLIGAINAGRGAYRLFQEAYADGTLHNSLLVPELMHRLSDWLSEDEQHEEARDLAEQAVIHQEHLAKSDFAPGHTHDLVQMLCNLGDKELRLGRAAEAAQTFDRAAAEAERMVEVLPDRFHPHLVLSLYRRAEALHRLGRDDEAAEILDVAYAWHRRLPALLAEHAPELLIDILIMQARLLSGMRREPEAVATLAERIDRESGSAGAPPHLLIIPLLRLTEMLLNLGRTAEAVKTAERATRLARAAGGLDQLARARHLAGVALSRSGGRAAEAIASLQESLAAYRDLAASQPVTARTGVLAVLEELTRTEMVLENWADALAHCDALLSAIGEPKPGQAKVTAPWLLRRSRIHAALGDHEAALADGHASVAAFRSASPADEPGLQRALIGYARQALHAGRPEEALDAANESESIAHRLARADPARYGAALIEAMQVRAAAMRSAGLPTENEVYVIRKIAARLKVEIGPTNLTENPDLDPGR